jgi:hypothetical protein
MEAALPPMSSVKMGVRSHKDIHESDELFKEVCDKSEWWRLFSAQIHSKGWWRQQISLMLRNLEPEENPLGQLSEGIEGMPFRHDYVESRAGIPDGKEVFLYGRMDIGYGVEGYGRDNGGKGVHIDMPQRIVSGLLYFTDQNQLEGGEFQRYSQDGKTLIAQYPVQRNRAILSFQAPGAYHAVNPVTKAITPRVAAYFALSCSKPLWRA